MGMLVNPKKITERMTQRVVEIDDPRLNMLWNKYIGIAGNWAISLRNYYKEATDPSNKYNTGKILVKAKEYGDASYDVIVLQHEIMELLQYFVQNPPFTDVDKRILDITKPDKLSIPVHPREPPPILPITVKEYTITQLPKVMQDKVKNDLESGNVKRLWGSVKNYAETVFHKQGIVLSVNSLTQYIWRKYNGVIFKFHKPY